MLTLAQPTISELCTHWIFITMMSADFATVTVQRRSISYGWLFCRSWKIIIIYCIFIELHDMYQTLFIAVLAQLRLWATSKLIYWCIQFGLIQLAVNRLVLIDWLIVNVLYSGVVMFISSCPAYLADCTTSGRVLSIQTRKRRSFSTWAARVRSQSPWCPDHLVLVSLTRCCSVFSVICSGFPCTHPGKSWNLRKEFSRPVSHGKWLWSWKSHGIPPIGHGFFQQKSF